MPANRPKTYSPATGLLNDRVVVVTGAGDGIGREAALTYAKYGADVVLLGRTRTKLEAVNDQICSETQTRPLIVPLDLEQLQPNDIAAFQQSVANEYKTIHGLLHNASLLGPKLPIAQYPEDDWVRVMKVNVEAQFLLTKVFLPFLKKAEDATIVLTSSGVGRRGRANWGAYAVSKFATEGFAEVLADELRLDGIRVNSLNPGGTRTAMRVAAYPAEDPNSLPLPTEHMPLYLYLMGPDSRGVTGKRFDAQNWTGPDQ